jgi:hypothetical protein
MSRRIATLCAAVVISCLLGAPSAFAWCNGPSDGGVGNGYGTHDWILARAIEIAQDTDGQAGTWIDQRTALRATDDPDTYDTNSSWHLFRNKGNSRGGPQKVADLYYEISQQLKKGETAGASKNLGLLAHYYGDLVQPFHTTWDGHLHKSLHSLYEHDVDDLTGYTSQSPKWSVAVPARPIKDVRARGVAAAKFARARYKTLYKYYGAKHSVSKSKNPKVYKLTGEVLSRAVNDMADLIVGMPQGAGLALAPKKVSASLPKRYPGRGRMVCAYATCKDASGHAVEGAVVVFSWPMPDGSTKKQIRWTDPSGVAHDWEKLGHYSLMRWRSVAMRASSSGTSTVTSAKFMVTPRLAGGSRGIKTSLSTHSPKQGTKVKVSTSVHDSGGHAVAGLPITFYWKLKSGTVKIHAVTNSHGMARATYDIGKAAKGYRVVVRGQVISDSTHRSSSSSFVTH